jgi:hypothetical protein
MGVVDPLKPPTSPKTQARALKIKLVLAFKAARLGTGQSRALEERLAAMQEQLEAMGAIPTRNQEYWTNFEIEALEKAFSLLKHLNYNIGELHLYLKRQFGTKMIQNIPPEHRRECMTWIRDEIVQLMTKKDLVL